MADATEVLQQIQAGNELAAKELFPLVYGELRKLAASQLKNESSSHTLQPTELVHEAFLRLIKPSIGQPTVPNSQISILAKSNNSIEDCFEDQAHFFAVAAEAMRRILIDYARKKKRLKRGAEWKRVSIDLNHLSTAVERLDSPDYLLSLDEAISQLDQHDPTAAELVKLRYFSGLTVDQAAMALGISSRTAGRTWNYARVWLYERISKKDK